VFDPFSLENFMFLCFFFIVLICFSLNFCSSLDLDETLVFWFGLWLNQYFRVDPVRSKPGQILKVLFGLQLF
jgi:hypothetical protein